MDSSTTNRFPIQLGPLVSLTVAVMSLGYTSVMQFRNNGGMGNDASGKSSDNGLKSSMNFLFNVDKNIQMFDMHSEATLAKTTPLEFTTVTKWNRTIYPFISTSELHSGLQIVQPGAWIPAHTHDTEELLIILSGFASVYDDLGFPLKVHSGCMVHIKKNVLHAIQNTQKDEPLSLIWVFPVKFGVNKFHFRSNYEDAKGSKKISILQADN